MQDFDDHGNYEEHVAGYQRVVLEDLDAQDDDSILAIVHFGYFLNRTEAIPSFTFVWRQREDESVAVTMEMETQCLRFFHEMDYLQHALRRWNYQDFTTQQLIDVLAKNGFVNIDEYAKERQAAQATIDQSVRGLFERSTHCNADH